tara:strand:+ start:1043 stop:1198 length:156 start_codon:yes stop_codon:yes gene_type:complete
MVKEFKKPNGFIVKYDSNVHSKDYLTMLTKKFEEVKKEKAKEVKKTKKAGK